jgi:hypothetical protein
VILSVKSIPDDNNAKMAEPVTTADNERPPAAPPRCRLRTGLIGPLGPLCGARFGGSGKTGRVTLLYAALGDSMSIDIYAGDPGRGATACCTPTETWISPTGPDVTWPAGGTRVLDLTADGATTADVLTWQLPRLRSSADLVTLTVAATT